MNAERAQSSCVLLGCLFYRVAQEPVRAPSLSVSFSSVLFSYLNLGISKSCRFKFIMAISVAIVMIPEPGPRQWLAQDSVPRESGPAAVTYQSQGVIRALYLLSHCPYKVQGGDGFRGVNPSLPMDGNSGFLVTLTFQKVKEL